MEFIPVYLNKSRIILSLITYDYRYITITILPSPQTNECNKEAVVRRCSVEKVLLEKTCHRVSFLIKFIIKENLVQVFSYKFCEISKNTFFYWTPPVAASGSITSKVGNIGCRGNRRGEQLSKFLHNYIKKIYLSNLKFSSWRHIFLTVVTQKDLQRTFEFSDLVDFLLRNISTLTRVYSEYVCASA